MSSEWLKIHNHEMLPLYHTIEHNCSYIPKQEAINQLIHPYTDIDVKLYDDLIKMGFRRSGEHIYRPICQQCQNCLSLRIPVKQFKPNRSQRRCWNKNQDITVTIQAKKFSEEHYQLYLRYSDQRHINSSMSSPDRNEYHHFFSSAWCQTHFAEFRLDQELVAVSVFDQLDQSLSAVYTFFDPKQPKRGLGVFAILWLAQQCINTNKPYLYLGYWIPQCQKMSYKQNYRPAEIFYQNEWMDIEQYLQKPTSNHKITFNHGKCDGD